MKSIRFAIAAALVLTPHARADETWQKEIDRTPGTFAPLKPLKASYEFGWSALKAGTAEVEFSTTKKGELELKVKGASVGAVRAMWKMDSDSVSTVNPKTLLPIKLVQKETYSDESRTTTVDFNDEGARRVRERKPVDKDSGKLKKFKFGPVHDMHSALVFIRSQPLAQGDTVKLAVYPAAQGYFAEAKVLGRETVSAAGKKWPAIKLSLKLRQIDKKLQLTTHKKFKSSTVWLSDDADRLLLRVEADVMVGNVWMEMKSVNWTGK